MLVSPGHTGHLEATLVRKGMASLSAPQKVVKKMVETVLPSPVEPLVVALEAAGFQKQRVLVQMRLDLAQRISLKG